MIGGVVRTACRCGVAQYTLSYSPITETEIGPKTEVGYLIDSMIFKVIV